MKKLFVLLAVVAILLPSCQKINDRLDAIENRLDNIEDVQIATISQQIESINNSLLLLTNTDNELGEYINALEIEIDNLQKQITDTDAKIEAVEDELTSTINTEKADILAGLEAFKATVNGELNAIKGVLEILKAQDAELDGKIANLREYVDAELKTAEDWATATFATLEQYNEVVAIIATIEGVIDGINESIAALETRINEKIAKDIETACAGLSEDLQNAIENITEAYTSAISATKNELTEAYTAALQDAISALETSMKAWVNEQLSAYSTIVSTEAKITVLQSEIDGKFAAQKTYLEALVNALSSSVTTDLNAINKQIKNVEEAIAKNAVEIDALREELAKQKTELTEAYTEAIAKAIAVAKGEMSEELAAEIAAINERIDKSDVAAIELLIANCKARMETIEADIVQLKSDVLVLQKVTERLLKQIQSITYIPQYNDGMIVMDYGTKMAEIDFLISPKSAVAELSKVWSDAVSVKAIYTKTRAVDFIDLPIVEFVADVDNGVISLTVSGANLKDSFYTEQQDAKAMLEISDGNSYLTSDYISLTPNYNIQFEDLQVKAICCKNWDANNDGELSYAEAAAVADIGSVFKGNTDIIAFTELKYFVGLTNVSESAFSGCENLWKLELPQYITNIASKAFMDCNSIRYINIPNGVETIGSSAFENCTSLSQIHIPDSVVTIENSAFRGCTNLLDVIIGNNVTTIMDSAFEDCSGIKNLVFGINIKVIGDSCFNGCSSITEINIPNGVTTIEDEAFGYCTGLEKLYIPSSVTTLGVNITRYCTGELFIDCDIPNGEKTYYSYGSDTVGFSSVFNRSNFTKVIFGDNVRYVGQYSFSLCHNLTTLEFGENITEISGNAFHADNDNNGRISTVFVKSMVPPYQSNSFHQWYWSYSYGYYYTKMPSDLTIYVPRIAEDDYKAQWSVYSDKIVGYDF
ncbi:MAG: leucine-rich repeat protein [Alistipes sp.]|nr:leucine-rich repeat protein [Alistipes sp.]